jgi:drug/metabolite transporter (DMT)-like permease
MARSVRRVSAAARICAGRDGASLPLPEADQAAAIAYLALGVTVIGFLSWYSAVGLLGVERAGLFSGVLPVSALLVSALLGVAEITPARLLAVGVVAAGVTLGVIGSRTPVPEPLPAGS